MNDYDLRGPDYETMLCGPITASMIDADRRVREGSRGIGGWSNGMPNWAMFRVIYGGDSHLLQTLRDFCVAFSIAHCEAGGVRKGLPADEIGCLAGWDAYYALLNHRWVIAGMDVADVAGVDPKTYRRVRNHVYRTMRASLREYFGRLLAELIGVVRDERWQANAEPRAKLSYGRGFTEVDNTGDGCYRAIPLSASGGGGVHSDDLKAAGV